MSNWKEDAADANLRMAQRMLEQQGEINDLKVRYQRLEIAADSLLYAVQRFELNQVSIHEVIAAASALRVALTKGVMK